MMVVFLLLLYISLITLHINLWSECVEMNQLKIMDHFHTDTHTYTHTHIHTHIHTHTHTHTHTPHSLSVSLSPTLHPSLFFLCSDSIL